MGFRDVSELRDPEPLTGTASWDWDREASTLTVRWTVAAGARSMERGLRLRVHGSAAPSVLYSGAESDDEPRFVLHFPRTLEPRAAFATTIVYESLVDGEWRSPADGGGPSAILRHRDSERDAVRSNRPVVESPDSPAGSIVERALDDLLSLRNWDIELPDEGWIVNAGAPKYLGYFARDALIAGRQSVAFGPAVLRGALERAAQTQGQRTVPERDEEPGRIVHEMRRGPLADLDLRPFRRYYGSLSGAAAFVTGLADYWRWTGDRETVRRLLPNAAAALAWATRSSERHPDGLLATVRHAPRGLRNQGWKDSEEAVRAPDGSAVPPGSAPVEEQGLWYRALLEAAMLLEAFDDLASAGATRAQAARLREVVEDRFWMPQADSYAMAIGADGELVGSIGSNPVHLLAAGLPALDRARALVDRLFAPDLWTGWGVRTLSADHPAYNPFAYHLGTVWPVDSAAFAEGCRRYGFRRELEAIASGLFAAAGHCHQLRLPELFAGHGWPAVQVPTSYPTTQSPQAWSAGAVLSVIRSMLGLDARADLNRVIVSDPWLPSWLPVVRLRRMALGDGTLDLEFERGSDGATRWRVLDATGRIDVVEAAPVSTARAG
jgi:glycogen debranching enzyme